MPTPDSILKVVGLINPLMGTAVTIINGIREIRDAARAANPSGAEALPTDEEIIERLIVSAGLLKGDVAPIRAWLENLIAAEQPPTP